MKYLPIGLDVRSKSCVVVGGGPIGERKVQNLLKAQASVLLVSPNATPALMTMAAEGMILWAREGYRIEHLYGAFLAVTATDRQELNAQVVEDATLAGVLVCDASSEERSQFIFGALEKGEGFTVAVFTDGEDPSMARSVRDRISTYLQEATGPESPGID